MRKLEDLFKGCTVTAAVIAAMVGALAFFAFRSFLDSLPLSESSRVRSSLDAQQAQIAAANARPWDPWVTGFHEFALIAFWLGLGLVFIGVPVVAFLSRWRRAHWIWPRDGMLPIPSGKLEPYMAIEAVGAHHAAEIANARRSLPPAHMHVTAGATKESAEAPAKEDEHHEAPAFRELFSGGEANGN